MFRYISVLSIIVLVSLSCSKDNGGKNGTYTDPEIVELAQTILADESLDEVMTRARDIIRSGFNAGDGYGQVWIRDLATFIEISCEVYDQDEIRDKLRTFFLFQGNNGNIIDGYAPIDKAHPGDPNLITSDLAPGLYAHKNTVETDQESSLIHAIHSYILVSGDSEFLNETIDGKTVLERMEWALQFLLDQRYSDEYGLIWGATTADWGDVQPENGWGVDMNEHTALAIDIYDNAMFMLAIDNFLDFIEDGSVTESKWRRVYATLWDNTRKHLWDPYHMKFIPHVYLDKSPFSDELDEDTMWYHGGTAIAILAGILNDNEIKASIDGMASNVKASGAGSIGLTIYPPYPEKEFPNMAPYHYQNGGDWTWFGGRMIQALVKYGYVTEAYRELKPMVDRVIANDGFYEWYSVDNEPRGSGTFRGSAGVLGKAIMMLQEWARETTGQDG